MDFEFTNLGKNQTILISGAIIGCHEPNIITKLEGRALVLNENRQVTDIEWTKMVKNIVRIFKNKNNVMYPLLAQIYDSDHTTNPNLNITQIKNQIEKYDMIITWEGSSDKNILDLMNVNRFLLSMRGWDENQNGEFYLQLINLHTKQVLISHHIGEFNKQGRALKLSEAHNLVCGGTHGKSDAHDPITDVLWTDCLFKFLGINYNNLISEIWEHH